MRKQNVIKCQYVNHVNEKKECHEELSTHAEYIKYAFLKTDYKIDFYLIR